MASQLVSRFMYILPVFILWLAAPGTASAQARHPRMHYALYELNKARIELKEAAHDFGGHRKAALGGVDRAIAQIEIALQAVGDPYKGAVVPKEGKKYKHFPHIHRAIDALRDAKIELRDAKHNYGGHRKAALQEVNFALEQLQQALKFAKS